MTRSTDVPMRLLRELDAFVQLVAQDGEALQGESWYTLEEEVEERRKRVKELGESAAKLQYDLAAIIATAE
jgi:cell division septum initiation protein DivIVA